MPIIDEKGQRLQKGCNVNGCLPEIDLGCTSGPICCDEPKACAPICMPVRARDAIRLADFETSRWVSLKGITGCDVEFHWRRVSITINGTGSCAKEMCCFAPAGINKDNELLINWTPEFMNASPGYYFMQVHVEGHKPTVFLLYKPWTGVLVRGTRTEVTSACTDCAPHSSVCMSSCAKHVHVIQEEHYQKDPDCGGCDDSC